MSRLDAPVSLADLAAAGVRLRPLEVVTIVRELRTAGRTRRSRRGFRRHTSSVSLPPARCSSKDRWRRAAALSLAPRNCSTRFYRGSMRRRNFARPERLRLVVARAPGCGGPAALRDARRVRGRARALCCADAAPVVRQLVASWAESVAAESRTGGLDPAAQATRRDERVLESFAPATPTPVAGRADRLGRAASAPSDRSHAGAGRRAQPHSRAAPSASSSGAMSAAGPRVTTAARSSSATRARRASTRKSSSAPSRRSCRNSTSRIRQPCQNPRSPNYEVPEAQPLPEVQPDLELTTPIPFEVLGSRSEPRHSRRARVLAALAIPALLAIAVSPAVWYWTVSPALGTRPTPRLLRRPMPRLHHLGARPLQRKRLLRPSDHQTGSGGSASQTGSLRGRFLKSETRHDLSRRPTQTPAETPLRRRTPRRSPQREARCSIAPRPTAERPDARDTDSRGRRPAHHAHRRRHGAQLPRAAVA